MDIKAGDVVQLKSGGEQMTVSRIENNSDGTQSAFCGWFIGKKIQQRSFPLVMLDLVSSE